MDAGSGTGYGSGLRQFLKCTRVGSDVNPDFASDQYLDEWAACSVEKLSFKDDTFQAVSCNWVLEHVGEPSQAVDEVYRVLKRGGYFLFRTPNVFNYAIILSLLTPTRFHNWVRKKGADSAKDFVDNAPTHYRLNTLGCIRKTLKRSGFEIVELRYEGGASEYVKFSRPLFVVSKVGDLITDLFFLRWLKKDIVGVALKR